MRIKLIPLVLCCLQSGQAMSQMLPPLRVHPGLIEPPQAAPVVAAPPVPALGPREPMLSAAPPVAAPRLSSPPAARVPASPSVEIMADALSGRTEQETRAEGNVLAIKGDITMTADRLVYRPLEDEVDADGNVVIRRGQDRITGPHATLRLDDQVGYFDHPEYRFSRPSRQAGPKGPAVIGSGKADRIDLEGENHFRLLNATFSTCPAPNPDWYAQAQDLRLDYDAERAEGKSAKIVFKDVPILATPWLDFSLNDRRKSGLLAPTLGGSSRTGLDYTQPYYWDIAPNMDATFAPRLISRRGVQLGTEVRYLTRNFSGEVNGEYLPDDKEANATRDALFWRHRQNFGGGLSGSVDFNSVSDALYFSDLSSRVAMTSQANLLRQAQLAYGGGWWNAAVTAQRYQTLQDPAAPPVVAPYERLPQITFNASRPRVLGGMALGFNSEFVDFAHPLLDQGQRLVMVPQVSWPIQTPAFLLTPRASLHYTRYALDRRLTAGEEDISRAVPILSLDGSVVFERDARFFGKDIVQTLEPRLFYLRVPRRDQSMIPVFDSGRPDFNFAQMFAENVYSGVDRIGDANQLTTALTSRAIDDRNGNELMRVALGQRFYFSDQYVTLPGVAPRSGRQADVLGMVSGRLPRVGQVDAGVQYNPRDNRTERYNVGVRYQPRTNQVTNLSYRFIRDDPATGLVGVRDVDVSSQWPLVGRWYGVGRYNYSLRERRAIEVIGGLEYNGGCWVLRAVAHRLATSADATNTAFFVQLELNGFSRIGSNPLDLLKRSIGGYGLLNQTTADPIFGGL